MNSRGLLNPRFFIYVHDTTGSPFSVTHTHQPPFFVNRQMLKRVIRLRFVPLVGAEGTSVNFVFLLLTRYKMRDIFCSCFVRRFGNPQASLVFRSLIRTFAAENKMWIDLGCLQPLKKMLKNKSSWLDCIVTPNSFPLLIINFSKIKLH